MKNKKETLTKLEMLILLFTPKTEYSSNSIDRYVLVSNKATQFAKGLDGEYIKPFGVISGAEIGGIKLVYRVITYLRVTKRINGISIPWFNKVTYVQTKVLLCPLKKHWSQKLSYQVGGKTTSPFMNLWFVLNQNYSNLHEAQHYLELISEVEDKQLATLLDKRTKTFCINNQN